jgi:PAS domain S-box-containing protein
VQIENAHKKGYGRKILLFMLGVVTVFWIVSAGFNAFILKDGSWFNLVLGIGKEPFLIRLIDMVIAAFMVFSVFLMVMKLKQNEQRLLETEARFRELTETLPETLFEMDLDGNLLYANRKGLEIFGYAAEDLAKGINVFQVIAERDKVKAKGNFMRVSDSLPSPGEEYTLVRKDGTAFPAIAYTTPIKMNEKVVGFRGFTVDITERNRAQEALRESEEKYRNLVDNMNDGLYLLNTKGYYTFVNKIIEHRSGMPAEWYYSTHFLDQVLPPFREKARENFEKVLAGITPPPFEYKYVTPNGNILFVETNARPLYEKGKIIGIQGLSRDITWRKQAEEAIFNSREMLRTVLDTIPQRVFWKDRNSIYLGCNKPLAQDCGFADPSEVVGKTDYETTSATTADLYRADEREVMETGRAKLNYEETQVKPDGTQAWLMTSKVPLHGNDGRVIGILGTYEDITERKRAEVRIREYSDHLEELVSKRTAQIQELERQQAQMEKLAAAGRLAARIAHEINNPLAGIKNSFLLIKGAIPDNHPYFAYVARIEKEINRIAGIVRHMFDLYRPEQTLPQEFSIRETIEDISILLQPLCQEHQLTLEVETQQAPNKICLPENLLRQILYNLIINAVQASPPGKTVRITAVTDPKELTLTVIDQGEGILEEVRSKIYEPFFTTKNNSGSGGLGLGLSVSKGLVESMKGKLEFETQLRQGTTFRVVLPLDNLGQTEVRPNTPPLGSFADDQSNASSPDV